MANFMDTTNILLMLQTKLLKNPIVLQNLQQKLDKLDDNGRQQFLLQINLLELKNPNLTLWIGSFLFGNPGVSNFMIAEK